MDNAAAIDKILSDFVVHQSEQESEYSASSSFTFSLRQAARRRARIAEIHSARHFCAIVHHPARTLGS